MTTNPAIPEPAHKLLDYIGRIETGRTGDSAYRTIIGHHEEELEVAITELSVDELLAQQEQWPARGWASTAAGKYQIIRGTLFWLKDTLPLSGRELFDPMLQDRLGYALLVRCGFEKLRARRLRRRDFALALAKEWAGIPVLRTTEGQRIQVKRGQSFYSGVGRNAATSTPEAFEDALDEALGPAAIHTVLKTLRRWKRRAHLRRTS
jgi:hypothetical protein